MSSFSEGALMDHKDKTKTQLIKELEASEKRIRDLEGLETRNKEEEETASELLHELKTIFDNLPLGIAYLDENYNMISVNKFFSEFTGMDEDDLIGKACYDTVGEYAGDSEKEGYERICTFCKKNTCFKTRQPTVMERPLKGKIVRVTTIPEFHEDGEIYRFLEIVEDITEMMNMQAETMRAAHLASLGELAAGVAHEINNPANGIINYAQMLANITEKGSRENEIGREIMAEGRRIARIVKSLLSFARDRKEEKKPAQIHVILEETLSMTERLFRKHGAHVSMDVAGDLPLIYANPQQIQQVFLNMLNNARYALNQKYAGTDEEKRLDITGEKTTVEGQSFVRITFLDRGTGIPADVLNQVTDPFFSTKPSGQGTGLGLSISHGILSDHNGRLRFESREGEYTKVIVELPIYKDEDE